MATVAVDLDDTLYSFCDVAREIIADAARGADDGELATKLKATAYAPWTEWRTPPDLMGLDLWLEVCRRAHDPEIIRTREPYPHVWKVLWDIVDAGHDILYISNRASESYGATIAWIEAQDLPHAGNYDEGGRLLDLRVQLICTSDDKMPLMSHCQYLIDDRPKTLVQFVYDFDWKNKYGSENSSSKRMAFGLHKEFNADLTDVPGVYLAPNWNLLEDYLQEKGLVRCPSLAR